MNNTWPDDLDKFNLSIVSLRICSKSKAFILKM
jgi:hypothetical protein